MLENESLNNQVDATEETSTSQLPTAQSAADELPRPPRGRRSATRPAGPPPPSASEPALAPAAEQPATESEAVEAPEAEAEVEAVEAPEAEEEVEEAPEDHLDSPEPAPAPRTRRRATRVRAHTEPGEAEATRLQSAESEGAEPETDQSESGHPEANQSESAQAEPTQAESVEGEPVDTESVESEGPDSDIEAALSAVEAAAAKRPRRTTRATTAAEVDTQQVLASLAAAIAGRSETIAEIEPGAVLPALEAPAQARQLAAGKSVEIELPADQAASETEDEGHDEEEDQTGEQDASSSAQRRRRRRGGRRRRRGSASGAGDETADSEDEQAEADHEEPEGADSAADPEVEPVGAEPSTTASSTRRRRRRRRRGDESLGSDEEQGDVVVRVREPRAALSDEITGIEGSTRLEAKKQRRREGRSAGRHRAPILTEAEFLARREAVDRVMLVRQSGDHAQIAVLEDDVLVEHYVDRSSSTSLIGNIYLGRVQNVLPSMEAVFIDIGRGRNAVLYAGEVDWDAFDVSAESRKVETVFKSGQSVLVQVSKDPVGAKGARLTGHVAIPGRYVVYSPGGHLSGISRKLPDAERQRLKQVLDTVVSQEASVIVRTAAEGASAEELVHDVERLKAHWQGIEKKAKQGGAPRQLYAEPDLTLRIIRDTFTPDFRRLIVAGNGGADDVSKRIAEYVHEVAPQLADRLIEWDSTSDGDPFAKFRVDEQISKALERKVFLPSGGSLVIDRTEAMTVIDVNTGKFTGAGGNLEETITRNNLEAAEEIVRQLRLRDVGGIIVIDFIDMVLPSNRELLLRRLVECLGRDRTRHQVSEVTSLGLVQMTRKRIGTGLAEAYTEVCDHCNGRGYLLHEEPVESQAPADGGERRGGRTSSGNGQARATSRTRATKKEEAPKAGQVQPSDASRQAAAKLAAASRHLAEPAEPDQTGDTDGGERPAEPMADEAAASQPVAAE